jgi:hypothetical protein
MKTKRFYFGLAMLSLLTWGCSSKDELSQNSASQGSLKTSISSNAQTLTAAVNSITTSAGYTLLNTQGQTSGPSMTKQSVAAIDSTYSQILLTDISGVWDYKAALYKRWSASLLRFFQNNGTSSDMIVRLPESKVKNPNSLLRYSTADTTLTNNYVIDVSKYAYHFNRYLGWDYNLASNISISGVNAGDLTIQSSNHKTDGYHFTSSFAFADGYTASTSYTTGDTIISAYNISKASKTLYEEKFTAVKTRANSRFREKEYSLTIGNVEIIRQAGPNNMDSAKVYVDGVLQLHSTVKIVADSIVVSNGTESTITNHNRTIQITFDDGTTTTVKALLGSTIDNISTLFTSLRETYFATGIVDWIAWDIYINKK